MATVSPVANWYEDPSGRHEGRFWDGYTWTAHVFDAGVATIDPPTTAASAPPAAAESTAGHGTRQLQAMATQASITAQAASANGTPAEIAAPDRRTLFGMSIPSVVGLAVFAVVAAIGISATGIFQAGSGTPQAISTTVSATGDGFTAEVPLGWAKANAAEGSPFDASYSTPGLEPVAVEIGDLPIPEAALGNPASRTQTFDQVAQMIAGQFGQVVKVTGHQTRSFGGRAADLVTVQVVYADGGTGEVAQYFVVGTDRSVVIAASGSERNVAAHLGALGKTASSVRFLR